MNDEPRIAVLVPCYNESATVAKVIDDFRAQLPEAEIYVFDNASTDETARIAEEHGATVVHEPRQGKGYVVEAMFRRVDADYYVMVDGDDTYPAEKVRDLLAPVRERRADMAIGARLAEYTDDSFRPLHVAGNRLVRGLINRLFGAKLTDILTGYRAFNRHVVEALPAVSSGFEIETEMTVQLLYLRMKIVEVVVPYRERPEGSESKLRTFRDGFRVLWKLFSLFRSVKPLTFFGVLGLVFFALGLAAGIPPIVGYIRTGIVERFPLAILATGLMLLSGMSLTLGVLLHAINWRFLELHNVLVRDRDRLPPSRRE